MASHAAALLACNHFVEYGRQYDAMVALYGVERTTRHLDACGVSETLDEMSRAEKLVYSYHARGDVALTRCDFNLMRLKLGGKARRDVTAAGLQDVAAAWAKRTEDPLIATAHYLFALDCNDGTIDVGALFEGVEVNLTPPPKEAVHSLG